MTKLLRLSLLNSLVPLQAADYFLKQLYQTDQLGYVFWAGPWAARNAMVPKIFHEVFSVFFLVASLYSKQLS